MPTTMKRQIVATFCGMLAVTLSGPSLDGRAQGLTLLIVTTLVYFFTCLIPRRIWRKYL